MNRFTLEIFDDTGSKCTFYTVRFEDTALSETDKFFEKFKDSHKVEIQELAKFLELIGNQKGALAAYFRFENFANALPPSKYQLGELVISFNQFPLRLYCLRISNELVVLFNGGEKTSQTAQTGKTSMAFHEANLFAEKILKALQNGEIKISENHREFLSDDSEIIL